MKEIETEIVEPIEEVKVEPTTEVDSKYEEKTKDFLKRLRDVPNFMLSEFDKVRLLEVMGQNPNGVHSLREYSAVSRYKSVFRAIRRGHVSVDGQKFPDRPFNNRKNRKLQNKKKSIYNDYKRYLASVA